MKKNVLQYLKRERFCESLRIFSILSLLFLFVGFASAKSSLAPVQPAPISVSFKNISLKEAFRKIEKESQFIFIYNDNIIDIQKKVSLNAKNETIEQILEKLLNGTSLSYKITDRQIAIFNTASEKKQTDRADNSSPGSVSGVVLDESNQPLTGVTVMVKGSTAGTITDLSGKFALKVNEQDAQITFSYIGYKSQSVKAVKENLKVIMLEDTKLMDELVVIGYGSVRKSDLTGAVSSLKEKDFNKGMVASPTEMMQGRIPGVNITTNGGEPGAGVSVRIRGANSIRSGQDPLYVIDGVPLDITDVQPSGASLKGVDAMGNKNPLNFLNPDDIESIDALKDASATAIYGSRGANGVIIVTTKKGKEGKTKVSYSGYAGISELPSQYNVLNAAEYNAARAARGLAAADMGSDTNWQNEIFRTAYSQNHSLSISGGSKNSNYRASFNYMNQDGIILKTGMEKYTGRINASTKTLNDRLTIEVGLTAARTNDQRAPLGEGGGVEGDLLIAALKLNPTYPVYNADGTYYQISDQVRNPVAMINLTNDNTQTDRILANITTNLNIMKGLNYKLNYSVDQTKAVRKVTQDAQLSYMTDKGTATINNVELGNSLIENYLTYDFNLGSNHKFNILAGQSYQKFRIYTYGLTETGFAKGELDNLNDLALGKSTQAIVSSDITLNELQSFFGRINYTLLDKYLFTVNFRTDGSTKFGDNNKYGYFPSAAFAWRMNDESFIKKLDIFSNLKMRLGAGITGNQEIASRISKALLGSVTGAVLNGGSTITPGLTYTRTPNPNIKWEKSTQYNWGLDFGFLKGRLSGTIDLFHKTTTDVQMYNVAIMPAPAAKVWSNEKLNIINKGLELALNTVIIDTKDWNWSANANFSKIVNKVENMTFSRIPTGYPAGPGITGIASQYIVNNESLGTFWGKTFEGFDANGKSIFAKDANGKDLEGVIGHALPDFTYNFSTSLSWKGIDLALNFNGVQGNEVYNNLANIMDQMTLFGSGWNTTSSAIASTETTNNVLNYSSRFIEDGSYLRLSNATLGYTFKLPKQNYINRLRVYVSGSNLLTFTKYSGYDPEVNATRYSNGVPAMGIGWTSYPKARTFTVGVNVDL